MLKTSESEAQKTPQQSPLDNQIIERLVLNGDLSKLSPTERVKYYNAFCMSLGLNPLTKPFQIIRFRGGDILYATKDCTEQLRKIHKVSISKLDKAFQNNLFIVTATAEDSTGRQDAASGVIFIGGMKGDNLANALMKAETKAKRRVTLSICGLGILDESETDNIGSYKKIDITSEEIIEIKNTAEDKKNEMPPLPLDLLTILDDCLDPNEIKNLYEEYKNKVTAELQNEWREACSKKYKQLIAKQSK
jgi:hypothetical protein